jgi:hypothetical protein
MLILLSANEGTGGELIDWYGQLRDVPVMFVGGDRTTFQKYQTNNPPISFSDRKLEVFLKNEVNSVPVMISR